MKNFLVFMTDHQRGDMQPPGSIAKTPNMDRLYKNGISFSNAYCPSPHCCPSRATFFSGLYPSEHGIWNNVNVSNALSRSLYDGVRLFSEDLAENGYDMYFSGKWHVSATEGPDSRGFTTLWHDAKYGPANNKPDMGDWASYNKPIKTKEMTERCEGHIIRHYYPDYKLYGVDDNPYFDNDVVEAAAKKLVQIDRNRPFFMYVGTLGPHEPYIAPQRFLDMYDIKDINLPESHNDIMEDKPAMYRRIRDRFSQLPEAEQKEGLRRYLAFCTYEDYLFGILLDTLEQRGMLDETVVMYVSDHGDYAGSHGLWAKGLPCFKEAYHINSVIGYGGIPVKEAVSDEFVSLADYAPTILEMAGISTNRRFVGKSLAPFLYGKPLDNWRSEMYTQSNGNEVYGIQRSVFNKEYKFVHNTFDFDEFYDLRNDPHEVHNLINEPMHDDDVKRMSKLLWSFAYENKDSSVNPYIMTGLAKYGPGIAFS